MNVTYSKFKKLFLRVKSKKFKLPYDPWYAIALNRYYNECKTLNSFDIRSFSTWLQSKNCEIEFEDFDLIFKTNEDMMLFKLSYAE